MRRDSYEYNGAAKDRRARRWRRRGEDRKTRSEIIRAALAKADDRDSYREEEPPFRDTQLKVALSRTPDDFERQMSKKRTVAEKKRMAEEEKRESEAALRCQAEELKRAKTDCIRDILREEGWRNGNPMEEVVVAVGVGTGDYFEFKAPSGSTMQNAIDKFNQSTRAMKSAFLEVTSRPFNIGKRVGADTQGGDQ